MKGSDDNKSGPGKIEPVDYSITYDGKDYEKEALVYVPDVYDGISPMNILYLMHGSTGSGWQLADDLSPLLDEWIENGEINPLLVVFPTYYPDQTFVVSDYSRDYPLNHFFATDEIHTLMQTVEGKYRTFAEGTDETGLKAGRKHRAFGGYSMGGVTTWDVLAYQSSYFADFMPMAGDCWIDRMTDVSGDEGIADLLAKGLQDNGYTDKDFRIIAMVGGNDGTKYSMQPQIEALGVNHADLITENNLIYWENSGGGHSEESLEAEVHHGIPYLFQF